MEGDIDRRRLGSYLNDHLAGSVGGIRTARRAAEENVQNEYGALLGRMARELEEEQNVLRQVLRRLEVPENPLKKVTGWATERAEEMRAQRASHGSLPMKRLMDLEALLVGATGNRCLWQTLEFVAIEEPALAEFDFASLQERAGRRVSRLGQLRLEARLPAFTSKERRAAASPEATAAPEGARAEAQPPTGYTGPERRSGRDRRVEVLSAPASLERRSGSDRRVMMSSSGTELR